MIRSTLLVRPIIDEDVDMLAETDEAEWDTIEVRLWPDAWEKPSPHVLYHVVSGNHRTSAARKKGLYSLTARIIDAPDEVSYTVAAIKSNTRHGKNFNQEQRLALAQKLAEQGLSLAEIAKTFNVHKSTVGNWLSGRDSNASKKLVPKGNTVAYATNGQAANEVSGKLLGWLAMAPLDMSIEHAQQGFRKLPPGMQLKAQNAMRWLADVLEGEAS